MVELSGSLESLFSETVERRGDSYVIEIPAREVELGAVDEGDQYRVGLFAAAETAHAGDDERTATRSADEPNDDPPRTQSRSTGPTRGGRTPQPTGPPVEEDETRVVTIESVGDEGDGIAKVERGYVIIVDGASVGETVRIRVHTVTKNVAFADVVERDPNTVR